MASSIFPAKIVWVRVGPRGDYKDRPAVVLSQPDSDGNFLVVCCTSQVGGDQDNEILLPYDPVKNAVTKFREPVAAVLDWPERINTKEILRIGGFVPPTYYEKIQDGVREKNLPSNLNKN